MSSSNDHVHALIVLSGLPGSGKTTLAARLCQYLEAEHVESDAIRRELSPEPAYTAEEHERVFHEVDRRARAALAAGRSTVVDATNLRAVHRERYPLMAAEAGARLVCVHVTAPFETLVERVRQPRDGFSQAGEAVLRGLAPTIERFKEAAVVIDSRFAVEASVGLVLRLARGD